MACDFRDCHSDHSAGLVAGRFKMRRTASPDGRGASQFVAVRVDCACIVRIGDVPEPSWSGRQRRGFRRQRHGVGSVRRGESDRWIGGIAVFRLVVEAFVLAADPFGLAA